MSEPRTYVCPKCGCTKVKLIPLVEFDTMAASEFMVKHNRPPTKDELGQFLELIGSSVLCDKCGEVIDTIEEQPNE